MRRFWKRVLRGDRNECWPWVGPTDKDGYGAYAITPGQNQKRVHRISYEFHFGKIPSGMLVCHECDNPPCCNPSHLFLSDCSGNMKDKINKGRGRWLIGSLSPTSKLTESQIRQIKQRYVRGWKDRANNQTALAREFGVDQAQISRIVNDNAWLHV